MPPQSMVVCTDLMMPAVEGSPVLVHSRLGTSAPLKKTGQLPLIVTILLPETISSGGAACKSKGALAKIHALSKMDLKQWFTAALERVPMTVV